MNLREFALSEWFLMCPQDQAPLPFRLPAACIELVSWKISERVKQWVKVVLALAKGQVLEKHSEAP